MCIILGEWKRLFPRWAVHEGADAGARALAAPFGGADSHGSGAAARHAGGPGLQSDVRRLTSQLTTFPLLVFRPLEQRSWPSIEPTSPW